MSASTKGCGRTVLRLASLDHRLNTSWNVRMDAIAFAGNSAALGRTTLGGRVIGGEVSSSLSDVSLGERDRSLSMRLSCQPRPMGVHDCRPNCQDVQPLSGRHQEGCWTAAERGCPVPILAVGANWAAIFVAPSFLKPPRGETVRAISTVSNAVEAMHACGEAGG